MEDVKAHIARFEQNSTVADAYEALPPPLDWVIVVRFYAALHLVHAYFITKAARFDAQSHEQRWKAIKASPELSKNPEFPVAYRTLKEVSEQVRYDPGYHARPEDLERARRNLALVVSMVRPKLDRKMVAHGSST